MAYRPIVVLVCNALDDVTRLERNIFTDSPAASRKVFLMAQALRQAGVRPYVLSLGRGNALGTGEFFTTKVMRIAGVPTIYAPYSHRRGLSELLSFFGLFRPLRRLARHPKRAVIFYNRMPAYIFTLREASRLGYLNFLDLEDGEVRGRMGTSELKERLTFLGLGLFERYCTNGALLACSALAMLTSIRPLYCYYGTTVGSLYVTRWRSPTITCLMSGTLSSETGASLLIGAIRTMRQKQTAWVTQLSFEITGKGESLAEFELLEKEAGFPRVQVHGRTTDKRYIEILNTCDVGLSLKLINGVQAETTFPSKVIEFAGAGLLVLTTDISDVRQVLGDGARYLDRNDPDLLISKLREIVVDRMAAALCARLGRAAAENRCAPNRAGEALRGFLFGERV